jgi:hypothetical protein
VIATDQSLGVHRRRRAAPLSVVLLAAVLGTTGCTASGADDAADVAVRFVTSVRSNPETACQLLAPRTLEAVAKDGGGVCPGVLEDSGATIDAPEGHPTQVDVAGHSARVMVGGQAVFLAWFDDGWRVTAAGCDRRQTDAGIPYECSIRGA